MVAGGRRKKQAQEGNRPGFRYIRYETFVGSPNKDVQQVVGWVGLCAAETSQVKKWESHTHLWELIPRDQMDSLREMGLCVCDSRARQELYRKPKAKGGTELLNKSLIS